jgi:hypothetical protein
MRPLIVLIGGFLLTNVDVRYIFDILPDFVGYFFIAVILDRIAPYERRFGWAMRIAVGLALLSLGDALDRWPAWNPIWASLYGVLQLADVAMTVLILVGIQAIAEARERRGLALHAMIALVCYALLGLGLGGLRVWIEYHPEESQGMVIPCALLGAAQFLFMAISLWHADSALRFPWKAVGITEDVPSPKPVVRFARRRPSRALRAVQAAAVDAPAEAGGGGSTTEAPLAAEPATAQPADAVLQPSDSTHSEFPVLEPVLIDPDVAPAAEPASPALAPVEAPAAGAAAPPATVGEEPPPLPPAAPVEPQKPAPKSSPGAP